MSEPILSEYLALNEKLAEHQALVQQHTEVSREITRRMEQLRPVIEKSVDPVCGSATKPPIRTFTDGKYRTISVFYDHNLNRGRITITKNDESPAP